MNKCIQFPFSFPCNIFCSLIVFVTGTGPYKVNGVPLRRVNQAYVIGTATKVDISGMNLEKFDDKYFAKQTETKKKKGETEFFEADKEVCFVCLPSFLFSI